MHHENKFDRKLTNLTLSHCDLLKIMICVFCFYFCVSFPTSGLNWNKFSDFKLILNAIRSPAEEISGREKTIMFI